MIYKLSKSDYIDLKAYRPIILFNTIDKALKTVIIKRIYFFAKSHSLLLST